MGRLLGPRRARRGRCPARPFPQLLVPLSALDTSDVALQSVVLFLLGSDLLGDLGAIGCVEFGDEFGKQMLVLKRFLYCRQTWAMPLSLARA
jgi:hypothetical protein